VWLVRGAGLFGLLDDPARVISGPELTAMRPEARAQALVEQAVIARVTPEQKYEIIQTLQGSFTVGFLGEGINDAPALKLAGVSLVVESAASGANCCSNGRAVPRGMSWR